VGWNGAEFQTPAKKCSIFQMASFSTFMYSKDPRHSPRSKELFSSLNISIHIHATQHISMGKSGLAVHPIRQLVLRASL
jgi:hypothetical protein